MQRRPDLIVPIRDRRQHKRYLTLKSFGIGVLVAFVLLVAISTYSELRRPSTSDYGRLVDRQIPATPLKSETLEVVQEEAPPIDDQPAADPMLVEPMARAQWLGDETRNAAMIDAQQSPTAARGGDVAIVGGPEGVRVVRQQRRKPVLSGGFGR